MQKIKKVNRILLLILMLASMIGASLPVFAADPNARVVSIFRTEGDSVDMTKGTSKQFAARAGLKLFDGYTVTTGKASYCYLQLDEASLAKMDEKSEVGIAKLSNTKLSVSLKSGGLAVDAATQKEGDVLEVRAGNSALAIRGTFFTMEYVEPDEFEVIITMLEGESEVDGYPLKAGETMVVFDKTIDRHHEIRRAVIDDAMSLFTLETIWEFRGKLLAAGIFTQEEIDLIPALIAQKKAQPVSADIVINYVQQYYETPMGGGGGGSGVVSITNTALLYLGGSATGIPYPTVYGAYLGATVPGSSITVTGAGTIGMGQTVVVGGASNVSALIVDTGATLTIAGGTGSTSANLTINNGGRVINNGTITNSSNTIDINEGTLQNNGTLNNTAVPLGQIILRGASTALLDNLGTFNNAGLLDSLTGSSTFSNAATFSNTGTFNNAGTANNQGSTTNAGAIVNQGSFNNSAALANSGSFVTTSGGRIDNIGGSISGAGSIVLEQGADCSGLDFPSGEGTGYESGANLIRVWDPYWQSFINAKFRIIRDGAPDSYYASLVTAVDAARHGDTIELFLANMGDYESYYYEGYPEETGYTPQERPNKICIPAGVTLVIEDGSFIIYNPIRSEDPDDVLVFINRGSMRITRSIFDLGDASSGRVQFINRGEIEISGSNDGQTKLFLLQENSQFLNYGDMRVDSLYIWWGASLVNFGTFTVDCAAGCRVYMFADERDDAISNTIFNEAGGLFTFRSGEFSVYNIANRFVNRGMLVIEAMTSVIKGYKDLLHDYDAKGRFLLEGDEAGATVSIGVGADFTDWDISNFYDTGEVAFTNPAALQRKTFVWDEDAGGSGVAGWKEQ